MINEENPQISIEKFILSSVLSHISLNLQISDEGIQDILSCANALSCCYNLQKLILTQRHNTLRDKNCINFACAISKCTKLQDAQIDFSRNFIVDEVVSAIGANLSKLENLQTLNLNLSRNKIRLQGINELFSSLFKTANLQTLVIDLGCNEIVNYLSSITRPPKSYQSSLKTLKICFEQNNAQDMGCFHLCQQLSNLQNLQNLELNLKNNRISFSSQVDQFSGLANLVNLQTLDLNLAANQIKFKEERHIFAGLSSLKNLINLFIDLSDNQMQVQGTYDLFTILAQCKQLQTLKLDLNNNKIWFYGEKEKFSGLANLKNLLSLELNLSQNQIQVQGMMAQFSFLSSLNLLQTFKINLNHCEYPTKNNFRKGFEQKQQVQNKINDQNASVLHSTLAQCQNISALEIQLEKAKLDFQWLQGLFLGMSKCKKIKNLTIKCHEASLSDKETTSLTALLKNCSFLLYLKLDLGQLMQWTWQGQIWPDYLSRQLFKIKRLVCLNSR
ncbi:hypothetical protein ABPG73_000905 [Tetrahymena malaccensis]